MNRLEARYALEVLDMLKADGVVKRYWYEAIKVRLAKGAWYTSDFLVEVADGKLELHEIKGFWREAARVRIKVAADKYPFTFISAQRIKGAWKFETF